MKTCRTCKKEKSISDFSLDRQRKDGHSGRCKVCHNAANKGRKDYELRRTFGISLDEYERMKMQQNGKCASCETLEFDKQGLVVDHCHATGTVRALLCGPCNRTLGHSREDDHRLTRLAEYVRKYRTDAPPSDVL